MHSSAHTILWDPDGLIEAQLPPDRVPYECLVKAVLAWTGPGALAERDYEQIALRVSVFESANCDYVLNHYDTSRVTETPKERGASGHPLLIDASTRLSRLPVVSVAKVRGRVRGVGSELIQAMDLRFASERALFCQPETANGNLPGGGGLEHLPRLLGRARALEVALSSDDYSGELAERCGWVNRTVPDGELDVLVDTLARRIGAMLRTCGSVFGTGREGRTFPSDLQVTE
jgi:enoyl-CoA hydratase/carnithine racemase